MGETRETFAGLGTAGLVIWYSLSVISTAIFVWGVSRVMRRSRRGAGSVRAPATPRSRRISRALRVTLTHAWIRRRAGVPGLAHAGVFYGFLVLLAGTAILALDEHIAKPLGIDFWHGAFYLGYSLFLDAFGFALVAGLLVLAGRRAFVRPPRLRYSVERRHYATGDWLLVAALLSLAVSGFALEGLRIAAGTARSSAGRRSAGCSGRPCSRPASRTRLPTMCDSSCGGRTAWSRSPSWQPSSRLRETTRRLRQSPQSSGRRRIA